MRADFLLFDKNPFEVPAAESGAAAIFVAVFFVVGFPCITTWAALGTAVRRLIARDRWSNTLSIVIMLLMGYTIVAIWLQ